MLARLLVLFALASLAPVAPALARQATAANSLAPANPAAAGAAVKLYTSSAGIQRVTGAELAAAGLDLAAIDPANLWLRLRGAPVALELRGAEDGRLDPADELLFYTAAPTDRWNAADIYWLTAESSPGPRMASRPHDGAAATRVEATERGITRGLSRYDSTAPGIDGDHWFMADLRAGPEVPQTTLTVPLTPTLPLAGGPLNLTLTGHAYLSGEHRLDVRAGAAVQSITWSGKGDWQRTITLAASTPSVEVTLVSPQTDGVLLDGVTWNRPVGLFFGGQGAHFEAESGAHRYQLSGLPAGAALYDIADPTAPVRVQLAQDGSFYAEAGADGRRFILAGPETLHTPQVRQHTPLDLGTPLDADALYIGPAALHAPLEPLLALRRAQGYAPATVDVQRIYDAWSYGYVAPEAIRSFLRYAAATWQRPPIAVTLVGDGSSDPFDYTRRGASNVNLVPPYLAMVDPWLGETACEPCYAQLDGDDPLADTMPDLLLGRLPVKSGAELEALVAKIVGYESAPAGQEWQRRQLFIADNSREADGTPDGAGDFAGVADQIAGQLPPDVPVERVYYDPTAGQEGPPWRVRQGSAARQRALDALDDGAGLVTYVGHSSMWQWAFTDVESNPSHLLGLYDPDTLTNGDRLPVVLSMTCLSSAFQTPAFSGTTLDERMLLNPGGGAVAVWGSTGLGVLHGHDALMRGFFRALNGGAGASHTARDWRAVGELVYAGYRELDTSAPCCRDALRTFALLGDPLTPLKAGEQRVFLPLAGR
jgi:hypothetical protein